MLCNNNIISTIKNKEMEYYYYCAYDMYTHVPPVHTYDDKSNVIVLFVGELLKTSQS